MARYDAGNSEVLVFSFKDGVLAKLAHDLKMHVESFSIDVDDATKAITATFDARTVKVVCRRKDGHDEHGGLGSLELGQIHSNLEKDVLESKKHPEIRFASNEVKPEGDGYRIRGNLTLHGQTRSIDTVAKKQGGKLVAEVRIHQPDFGIKPYSAMMGALKVQADVTVQVSVPA